MQAVGEIIEYDAALTTEHADRPRLVQRLDVGPANPLPPVSGRWLEAEFLGRRARGEQHYPGLVRPDASLVWRSLEGSKQPISHLVQTPSAGRSQTCPSYRAMKSSRPGAIRWISAPTGIGIRSTKNSWIGRLGQDV